MNMIWSYDIWPPILQTIPFSPGDAKGREILVLNDRQFAVESCLSTDSRA